MGMITSLASRMPEEEYVADFHRRETGYGNDKTGRSYFGAVDEFARAWENLKPSLDGRRLLVDLSGLDFVDPGGAHLLEEIYQETFADFVADSPLAKYFAEQARRPSNRHRKGI